MSDVAELEREIATTRARLHGTIDEIQSRLTVSGIVDEVLGQAGVPRLVGGGNDFVFGLLRRNPVPVMIAAAAVGFLIHRRNRRQAYHPGASPVVVDAGRMPGYRGGGATRPPLASTPSPAPRSTYPGEIR